MSRPGQTGRLRLLMVAAELAPLAKVGGLGDAVAGLAAALARRGHAVRVALPLYGEIDRAALGLGERTVAARLPVRQGTTIRTVRVHAVVLDGVEVRLLEADDLYGRPGIYGYADRGEHPDTPERLALHCQAALLDGMAAGWWPDVVHAHDAAAALAPVYLRCWDDPEGRLARVAGLLTIHNLAHQGLLPGEALPRLDLPGRLGRHPGELEYYGRLNPLKAGIVMADRVTTVSPTYAREVVDDPDLGAGLGDVLRARGAAFGGILNGIDTAVWDPRQDGHLPATYGPDDLAGKETCRRALLQEAGLAPPGDGPVLVSVGRLVVQKGYDLLPPLLDGLAERDARVVLLGTGDETLAVPWREAAAARPDRIAFLERFDEALAHRVYAGGDIFLMPSRFEPCGLAQMYAMRYGTLPVARRTGGLADTIVDADLPEGTGFLFDAATPDALRGAIERAWGLWRDEAAWERLLRRAMARDWSWDGPAAAYERLYRESLQERAASR